MGTRGIVAVKIDGVTKGSYNHWDSYPTWLGNEVLKFIRDARDRLAEVRIKARALEAIADGREPTGEEIARLKPYTDLGVSEGSTKDWYCLLRLTQGDLSKILDAGVYDPFPVPDQEWSYVVDLDDDQLVVYHGDEKVATIPFADLPQKFADDELKAAA